MLFFVMQIITVTYFDNKLLTILLKLKMPSTFNGKFQFVVGLFTRTVNYVEHLILILWLLKLAISRGILTNDGLYTKLRTKVNFFCVRNSNKL